MRAFKGVKNYTLPFIIRLDLIGISIDKRGVGVFFGRCERIGGFPVHLDSSCGEGVHNHITDRSLVPEDSSGVGDRKGIVGSGIRSCFDMGDIETLGEVGEIGDPGRVPSGTRVSSETREGDGSEDHENGDDDDEFDEGEARI